METADQYLTAELQPHVARGWRRAWLFVSQATSVLFGDLQVAAMDLVVTRRDTGAEVLRTHADVGSPDLLLKQVEKDLASMTVSEFVAEWVLSHDEPIED